MGGIPPGAMGSNMTALLDAARNKRTFEVAMGKTDDHPHPTDDTDAPSLLRAGLARGVPPPSIAVSGSGPPMSMHPHPTHPSPFMGGGGLNKPMPSPFHLPASMSGAAAAALPPGPPMGGGGGGRNIGPGGLHSSTSSTCSLGGASGGASAAPNMPRMATGGSGGSGAGVPLGMPSFGMGVSGGSGGSGMSLLSSIRSSSNSSEAGTEEFEEYGEGDDVSLSDEESTTGTGGSGSAGAAARRSARSARKAAQKESMGGLSSDEKVERRKERARMYSHIARKRQESNMRELKAEMECLTVYRLMIEESPDMIAVLSPDMEGRILFANAAFAYVMEGTPEGFLGKPIWAVIHESRRQELMKAVRAIILNTETPSRLNLRVKYPINEASTYIELSMRHCPTGIICYMRPVPVEMGGKDDGSGGGRGWGRRGSGCFGRGNVAGGRGGDGGVRL